MLGRKKFLPTMNARVYEPQAPSNSPSVEETIDPSIANLKAIRQKI
jgi:hypothetical protein